jgi:hypothetical protein
VSFPTCGSVAILNARAEKVLALDRGLLDRRGQEVHHRVEQALNPLVLERRAAQHRVQHALQRSIAERAAQILGGVGLLVEIVVEQLLVELRDRLQQLVARVVRGVAQVARNVVDVEGGALALLVIRDRLHFDQVDDALELLAGEHRHVNRHRARAQAVAHHPDHVLEVGAHAVHLVDERDARYDVLVGLPPHRLGLRLHAADRAEHRDRAVENAQAALDLDGEVDVTGGIDDVDAVVAPLAGGGRGGDGDAALALLLHPVHRGGAFMHLAHAVDPARIKEDALGQGGLAGVDMGHDANISILIERSLPRHRRSLPLVLGLLDSTTCLSVVESAVMRLSAIRGPENRAGRVRVRYPAQAGPEAGLTPGWITSDSERRPCWPPPSCACPRAS